MDDLNECVGVFVIEQPTITLNGTEKVFKLAMCASNVDAAKKFVEDNSFEGYKFMIIPNCLIAAR